MSTKPIYIEIENAITRFIMQHPGVNPRHILLERPDVIRVHRWLENGGGSEEQKIGMTHTGALIIYGLEALKAPDGTGITVVGYSGPLK